MAATSYSNLKTAITNWLDDPDGRYTSRLDDFIDMGEARIYREIRIRSMEKALSLTIASGTVTVPSDYLEAKYIYIDGNPTRTLESRDAEWILRKYPKRSSDAKPYFFAQDAGTFIFGPYPDSNYDVKGTYFYRFTALSDSNTTNWFTDNAPDLLLFACMMEAELFIGNDERYALWERRYMKEKHEIMKEDRRQKKSGIQRTIAS